MVHSRYLQHLRFLRICLMIDEWLSYLVGYVLWYVHGERNGSILYPIFLFALATNLYAYTWFWDVEKRVFNRDRVLREEKRQ